jgi:putative transposase
VRWEFHEDRSVFRNRRKRNRGIRLIDILSFALGEGGDYCPFGCQSVFAHDKRFIVLFFMELSTRRVQLGGIARVANGLWMAQIARNLTDDMDGFFHKKRYLIHDRDPLYTRDFLNLLAEAGIESVKLPPRSPNLNAYAERFVRSIKESCLERLIFFGENSLRNAIREFVGHYHLERNHQGLGNRLIVPMETTAEATGAVERRQRLGGLLNYYYRKAA